MAGGREGGRGESMVGPGLEFKLGSDLYGEREICRLSRKKHTKRKDEGVICFNGLDSGYSILTL